MRRRSPNTQHAGSNSNRGPGEEPRYRLVELLVSNCPEDLVNAIQPREYEYEAHDTNFVSSPHFASTRLYMIRRIPGKRPDRIDVVRLHIRTNNIPGIRVEIPE